MWFKISSNGDRRSNTYIQASFKKTPEHWDINMVLLYSCKVKVIPSVPKRKESLPHGQGNGERFIPKISFI